MRQEATRSHKGWALDTVIIHNEVLKQNKEEITAPPSVCMTCKDVSVLIFDIQFILCIIQSFWIARGKSYYCLHLTGFAQHRR